MNKKEFLLLEAIYEREVTSALSKHGIPEYQTKSKTAKKLEEDGFIVQTVSVIRGNPPVKVTGYTLTHLGRMSYCCECVEVTA